MSNAAKDKKVVHWDWITILSLTASTILIIFSFLAPYIFTSESKKERFNFTSTGAIGDTIGGLMNPFIALAGVLLTFLAFFMQIKANRLQLTLFMDGLEAEKKRDRRSEMTDAYHKLMLLIEDLGAILSDISAKTERIRQYFESERNESYNTNVLYRTLNQNYSRILSIDRLSIFKAFRFFVQDREEWRRIFSNLYNLLEFLPGHFEQIYSIADNHAKEMFSAKLQVSSRLDEFINSCIELITAYRIERGDEVYLQAPASQLCNQIIHSYRQIINEGLDEHGNPTRETDIGRINEDVLHQFIIRALAQRENFSMFDNRLDPLIVKANSIRRSIQTIRNRMYETSANIELEYKKLVQDSDERQSYLSELQEIKAVLREATENINVDTIDSLATFP